jgi:signal peptidase I
LFVPFKGDDTSSPSDHSSKLWSSSRRASRAGARAGGGRAGGRAGGGRAGGRAMLARLHAMSAQHGCVAPHAASRRVARRTSPPPPRHARPHVAVAQASTVLPWLLPPLHRAARRGDAAAVRRLLSSGADVDSRDGVGSTALMHAAEKQRCAALTELLSAGADCAGVNAWGWDAALYATTGPRADALLAQLIDAGGVSARADALVPPALLGGAHGRLLRAPRAPDAPPSAEVFGVRGALNSVRTSAADMAERLPEVTPGGVAIAGASCERLGLYAGQRYGVRALFWRPAGAPYAADEPRVPARSLSDPAPPVTPAGAAAAWELVAELTSPRWMPWGSTEVSVGARAASLRAVSDELRGAAAVALAGAAALLVALPALTAVTFAYVPSDSMAPSLLAGDAVLAELRPRGVAVGDVLLFAPPPRLAQVIAAAGAPPLRPGDLFIKRVVGLPGDTLSATAGVLQRNGAQGLPPPPGPCSRCKPARYDWQPPLTLREGELAMLGDNRGGSTDSHVWGALEEARVVGRVIWRWWPPERFGAVR